VGWLLRRCVKCGRYTLNKEKCPYCGGMVRTPHPPKFSPENRYAKYRRMLRRMTEGEKHGD